MVRLALDLVAYTQHHERVFRRARPSLYDEMAPTADSVLSNVGEAFDDESFREKRKFFRYALRSAGECEKQLLGFQKINALSEPEMAQGLKLVRDIRFDLKRLIAWTTRQIP